MSKKTHGNMEAKITIVDKDNNVIGSSDRLEAHLKGLWHRIAVVHVFNTKGQIYIQKRSPTADTSPNMWDHSAAGHVDSDETPDQAAKRELFEELGIKADNLTFIALYKTQRVIENKKLNRYWYVYKYVYDGEMQFEKGEVTTGKFVDVDWLKKNMQAKPEMYTDGIKDSLPAYLKTTKNI